MEIWESLKNVCICGENYEVSNKGNVRNVIRNKVLKNRMNKKGYLGVALYLGGVRHDYRVHRLVALAFISNPDNKPQINHIDGNKINNSVENLEWATNQENQIHAFGTGLQKPRRGIDNNSSKLTEKDVSEIRKSLIEGVSQYELARKYKVSRGNIASIQNGTVWKHLETEGFSPYKKDVKGENNYKAKLNPEKVKEIRKTYPLGQHTTRQLGKIFGVSHKTILNVIDKKTWKHID